MNLRAVLNTSESVVPGEEGSEEAKQTTGLLESDSGSLVSEVERILLTSQEQESQVKREE